MSAIGNDRELRIALDGLTPQQQRVLGGRFVASVLALCEEESVGRAVDVAMNPEASEAALAAAYRDAKAVSVKSYTACGKDADWLEQAAHFVAAAATACLVPESRRGSDSPAWKAAMQARMARNCEMIERGEGAEHNESETQYRLTAEFSA